MFTDEEANLIVWDGIGQDSFSFSVKESVKASFKSKQYAISEKIQGLIRWAYVTYKSTGELTLRIYRNGSSTPEAKTYSLTASANVFITAEIYLVERAKKLEIEVIEKDASTTPVEISRIELTNTRR